ncbi:MAG: hypothetical protein K0S71_569 [Clostridia bacterium]|jgi:hypothetical protein|nr:hypothetical protein [Clostridia bacterium]
MSDFDFSGLEEFTRALGGLNDRLVNKRVKGFLQKEGNKLRNHTKRIAAARVKKDTGRYLAGIKRGKAYLYQGDTWSIRTYNTKGHAHLIEDGHNIVRGGRIVGYQTGKKVFATAESQFTNEYFQDVEKFVDDILNEGWGF